MHSSDLDSLVCSEYPDGTLKTVLLKSVVTQQVKGKRLCFTDKGAASEDKKLRSVLNSVYRTKQAVYDKAHSMQADFFGTLTFSRSYSYGPDRYCKQAVIDYTLNWLKRMKSAVAPDLQYLLVFEQHKDGAWHCHCILGKTDGLTVFDSGRVFRKKFKRSRIIYNIKEWLAGWSDVSPVSSPQACANYIVKYVTKSLVCDNLNQHRYYCSRNIPKPEKITFTCNDQKEIFSYKTGFFVPLWFEDIDSFVNDYFGSYEFMHQSSTEIEDNQLGFNLQTEKNFYMKAED